MKSHSFTDFLFLSSGLVLLVLLAACDGNGGEESNMMRTQAQIEMYVSGTKTAKWEPEVTKTPRPTWTPRQAEEVLSEMTEISEPIVTEISHEMIPEFPGLPLTELVDSYSARSGAEGYATEGDYYADYQLLERPFGMAMNYLAQVDLRAAEISKIGGFIYVTIFLDQSVLTFDALYGVELDTNADGRGNILITVENPAWLDWSIEGVVVYADLNGDVGGSHIPSSDAPEAGDGFESLLFSKTNLTDPDLVFARINPDRGGSIQLAFKPELVAADQEASFFWRVWADHKIKNPSLYYYADHYPLGEAGSPLIDSPDYPLGAVYAVDNTCRMPFQIINTGYEHGLCGEGVPVPSEIEDATLPSGLTTQQVIATAVAKTLVP